MQFGQQSEKSRFVMDDAEQLSFFNEAEKESNAKAPEPTEEILVEAHTRKPKRTKEELAENLPVKEVICELPEKERVCGACGSEMKPIGKEYVRTELEIIPAQASVIRYYRMAYACSACEKETGEANLVKAEVPAACNEKEPRISIYSCLYDVSEVHERYASVPSGAGVEVLRSYAVQSDTGQLGDTTC